MPALGLGSEGASARRKAKRRSRLGRRRSGDRRPDSPIRYSSDHRSSSGNVDNGEAGGSVFCSTGGSVTDGGDHNDSPLAVLGHAGGGPPADPAPEARLSPFPVGLPPPKNPSKVTAEDFVQREVRADEGKDEVKEEVEEVLPLGSSKLAFPHPPGECQRQQCRSDEVALTSRKLQRRRPVSLDFNGQGADASIISPRFFIGVSAGMKKSSADSSRSRSSILPSPGTPNYRHGGGVAVYQKGWSSERVPLPAHSSCRRDGSRVILPFANGRTLPSKWEDAERWIFSPVSIEGTVRSPLFLSHYKRPKSKSGPLGPQADQGLGSSYSLASPQAPCFDSCRAVSITANSPFLAGVLIPEQDVYHNGNRGRRGGGGVCSGGIGVVGVGGGAMGGKAPSTTGDPYIFRSASIRGWSENAIESSSSIPSSPDDKSDGSKEAASVVSISTLRKDVATQMSPDGSAFSSPKEAPSPPSPASAPAIVELESHFSKIEVRDVQVDNHVTLTRRSKKHIARGSDSQSASITDWKKKIEANTTWEVTETAKSKSRYKREEAKITAWENLQKAKAQAEIRKLEMKLEKKRSSSMEKILNKLRFAQKKAQEMRSAVTTSQGNQVTRTTKKVSHFRKTGQIGSLSGCFTCHAF